MLNERGSSWRGKKCKQRAMMALGFVVEKQTVEGLEANLAHQDNDDRLESSQNISCPKLVAPSQTSISQLRPSPTAKSTA